MDSNGGYSYTCVGFKGFPLIGECLGVVLEMDEDSKTKKRLDRIQMLIWMDPQKLLPKSLAMDVDGFRFHININEEADQMMPDSCCWNPQVLNCSFQGNVMLEINHQNSVTPVNDRLNYNLLENHHESRAIISPENFGKNLGDLNLKVKKSAGNGKSVMDLATHGTNMEGMIMNLEGETMELQGISKIPNILDSYGWLQSFHHMQGKNRVSSSCPFVKGVFNILHKDLSTLEVIEMNSWPKNHELDQHDDFVNGPSKKTQDAEETRAK